MIKKFLVITSLLFTTSSFAYNFLPNPELTPGKIASVNLDEICAKNYALNSRNVSSATKMKVYKLYNIDLTSCRGGCKIDHLIPLSIGGSNDISNLWPHEYGAEWKVFQKTRLEVRLRKAICHEQMPIDEAQQCIASNWTQCYNHFYPNQAKGIK